MPPLTPWIALTTWQFVPFVSVGLAVAAGAYLAGVRAVTRRHPAGRWPTARTAAFSCGVIAIAVATQGSPGVYDDVSLPAHMVQHLLLIMVAPPLLVSGRPVTLALHATRNPWHTRLKRVVRSPACTALTWPPFGVALYSAVVLGTHLTGLIAARGIAHEAEHARRARAYRHRQIFSRSRSSPRLRATRSFHVSRSWWLPQLVLPTGVRGV